jgi:hypothetical protein
MRRVMLPLPFTSRLHVAAEDLAQSVDPVDPERGSDRVTGVAILIGVLASIVAGATIWLVLTDPVTVANAVEAGQISPLVRQLADIIYNALSGLLDYL